MENLSYILSLDPSATSKTYKKGTILQQAGDLNNTIFYIKKGILKSYAIDKKGKEHIFMFATENWMIADIESQEFNQPSQLFIDCIEDSEIITFNRSLLQKATLNNDQLKKNIDLFSRRIAMLQRRVILLMSASAKERYQFFLDTYPELPNRVPQRMIASYLGITPEALSKIRSEMTKLK